MTEAYISSDFKVSRNKCYTVMTVFNKNETELCAINERMC